MRNAWHRLLGRCGPSQLKMRDVTEAAQAWITNVTVGAGDAEVLLEDGSRSFMRDLRLGAKVHFFHETDA